MSVFPRHPHPDQVLGDDTDDDEEVVNPDHRLRPIRTAASTIAESIKSEARIARRQKRRSSRKGGKSRLFGGGKVSDSGDASEPAVANIIPGTRRNIYVNVPLPDLEVDTNGEPLARYPRNKVRTSSKFSRVCNVVFALKHVNAHRIYCPHIRTQKLV
jgi:phospholipid-translocating ATPase